MSARPTIRQIWLATARLLALRSTCSRLQVGAVITSADFERVLGVGYNGGAKGLRNGCDHPTMQGACGCLHAEINALLKAPGAEPDKALFVTAAPCVMCAKALINARVTAVFFAEPYRDAAGVQLLKEAGVDLFFVQPELVLR